MSYSYPHSRKNHALNQAGTQGNTTMIEQWKPFRHGYYEVSNLGRVRRVDSGRIHKGGNDNKGYRMVSTSYHGRQKGYKIHALVARKFIGPCPEGMEVHHHDHNKQNNRWDNLEHKTRKRHKRHHMKYGEYAFGEKHGRSKLTRLQVDNVIELYATGKYSYMRLAKKFNVAKTNIGSIVRNESWKRAA